MTIDEYIILSIGWENLKSEDLDFLADSGSNNTRFTVVCHPNTSTKTLQKLMYDNSSHIRTWVAISKKSDIAILDYLSTDPMAEVRCEVAGNKNTSIETLQRLTLDSAKIWPIAITAKAALKSRFNNSLLSKIKSLLSI